MAAHTRSARGDGPSHADAFVSTTSLGILDAVGPSAAFARGMAELDGRPVAIAVTEERSRAILAIEGHGTWAVERATGRIDVIEPAPDAEAAARALEGPVRLHVLAEHGVHVLHASAIAMPTGALVALTAPSGVGKSTFAAGARALGCERCADDLLPIAMDATGHFVGRPHFPQPKLAADLQYPADAPAERRLTALVRLERGEQAGWAPLPARAAMDLALRSTVATRVYSKAALGAHLGFCQRLGVAVAEGRIACGVLTVPHRPDAVSEAVREALAVLDAALRR